MWSELVPFSKQGLNLEFKSKALVETGVLKIAYELSGEDLSKILLPSPLINPGRVIGLWESTCFEMFIKNSNSDEYLEFNVTSEYTWNVFHFPNKKARLKEYLEIANLGVSAVNSKDKFCLTCWFSVDKLPSYFWSDGKMNIGLTAVIETKENELSYWAIKHADDKPNFHQHDTFIYEL